MREKRLLATGLLIAFATPFAGAQEIAPANPISSTPQVEQPQTAAEMPPKPPKVVCSGDQLTISAENSTLDSILIAVRGCSGAKIEVPEGAARTRTFEELGPGPIRKVLDALLSGTEFDYVIESSDANPTKVETVLLTARKKDGTPGLGPASTEVAMTPSRRAWMKSREASRPFPVDLDANAASTPEPAVPDTPAPQPADAAEAGEAKASPAPEATAAQVTPPPTPSSSTTSDPVKATAEKITSMQQMFDQRRQMMEKQNGTPAGQSSTPN